MRGSRGLSELFNIVCQRGWFCDSVVVSCPGFSEAAFTVGLIDHIPVSWVTDFLSIGGEIPVYVQPRGTALSVDFTLLRFWSG